jgi:hypothetical protein
MERKTVKSLPAMKAAISPLICGHIFHAFHAPLCPLFRTSFSVKLSHSDPQFWQEVKMCVCLSASFLCSANDNVLRWLRMKMAFLFLWMQISSSFDGVWDSMEKGVESFFRSRYSNHWKIFFLLGLWSSPKRSWFIVEGKSRQENRWAGSAFGSFSNDGCDSCRRGLLVSRASHFAQKLIKTQFDDMSVAPSLATVVWAASQAILIKNKNSEWDFSVWHFSIRKLYNW